MTAEGVPRGGRTNAIIDPVNCADEDPRLSVLWGSVTQKPQDWTQAEFKNPNNHSVVLRVDFGSASVLVAGDLETPAIADLIEKHSGTAALNVDVWQVDHHGALNGADQPFLDALTPVIALLSTGAEDRHQLRTAWAFGHPRKTVIDLLAENVQRARAAKTVLVATGQRVFEEEVVDRAIYATGWDGTVVVTARGDGGYEVGTER